MLIFGGHISKITTIEYIVVDISHFILAESMENTCIVKMSYHMKSLSSVKALQVHHCHKIWEDWELSFISQQLLKFISNFSSLRFLNLLVFCSDNFPPPLVGISNLLLTCTSLTQFKCNYEVVDPVDPEQDKCFEALKERRCSVFEKDNSYIK